nr:hypothetical protein [uncultured Schaedlerella sp.]
MVKINENEALISKNELGTLFGAAMALTLDPYVMSDKLESLIMGCAAEAQCKVEDHIWGVEKIPEETLDLAKRILHIYEESLKPVQDLEPAREDKQAICRLLMAVLQKTRAYHDLADLRYEHSTVTAKFTSGGYHRVNVEADSGIAMIHDILAHI